MDAGSGILLFTFYTNGYNADAITSAMKISATMRESFHVKKSTLAIIRIRDNAFHPKGCSCLPIHS